MRGNIVIAAAVLGLGLVAGCVVLVLGMRAVVGDATGRVVSAVERHGEMTQHAGADAGLHIERAMDRLSAKVDEHGASVTIAGRSVAEGAAVAGKDIREGTVVAGREVKEGTVLAGRDISTPDVTMKGPVPIVDHEPLRVQGTAPDGSLPVDAELGGQEPRKQR